MKYCLTKTAKRELIMSLQNLCEGLLGVLYGVLFILFTVGLFVLPLGLYYGTGEFSIFLAYIGILSWTLIFSLFLITFKQWLQKSIVKC